jgi:hypothetical protein
MSNTTTTTAAATATTTTATATINDNLRGFDQRLLLVVGHLALGGGVGFLGG